MHFSQNETNFHPLTRLTSLSQVSERGVQNRSLCPQGHCQRNWAHLRLQLPLLQHRGAGEEPLILTLMMCFDPDVLCPSMLLPVFTTFFLCSTASVQVWLRNLPGHHRREEPTDKRPAPEDWRDSEAGSTQGEEEVQTPAKKTSEFSFKWRHSIVKPWLLLEVFFCFLNCCLFLPSSSSESLSLCM